MQEQATASTSSWRRWLGQRVAIGTIAGTVIMSAYSGLAPTLKRWAASFTLTRTAGRAAGGPDGSPWIMGLVLWLLAVITGAILWGIARQVLENADDPDQDGDLTDGQNNGHARTWDF